jgi:hypothetical protein
MSAHEIVITAPQQPHVGNADPHAVSEPATSAEEKKSQETSADNSNTTIVASAEEIEQLDREINTVALSIMGSFEKRVKTELLPRLYRMRSILPHGEWGKWYDAFCERHCINWSIRDVQRKFKQLEDGWKQNPTRISNSKNTAVVQTAKALAEVKEKLGKSADDGSEQAKAIITEYEKKHEEALVQAQANTTTDTTEKSSPEMRVNKRLATIVEVGEKYIRVMERVMSSNVITLDDRQQRDLEKASESWRKVLRDARELSFAVKIIEGQTA